MSTRYLLPRWLNEIPEARYYPPAGIYAPSKQRRGFFMKVTDFTRRALAYRREDRRMTKLGYRRCETDWEIHRGGREHEVIVDARISCDGKYVWTKLGKQ
jgi:hypothetical protein